MRALTTLLALALIASMPVQARAQDLGREMLPPNDGWAAFGGLSEEIWSAPRDGVMMGMYRLVRDGKPVFYELLTIVEHEGTLLIRLKHFNPDLTGWEEKDRTVDFPLVAKAPGLIQFAGMTFEPDGDRLTVHLAIGEKDGSIREQIFRYTRVPPAGR